MELYSSSYFAVKRTQIEQLACRYSESQLFQILLVERLLLNVWM